MATVNTLLYRWMGWTPTGDLGALTFYTDKRGQTIAFPKMPPLEPPSIRQTIQRQKFQAVADMWAALTPTKRTDWERASKRALLRITGYNLFTYWAITQDTAAIRSVERASGVDLLD